MLNPTEWWQIDFVSVSREPCEPGWHVKSASHARLDQARELLCGVKFGSSLWQLSQCLHYFIITLN